MYFRGVMHPLLKFCRPHVMHCKDRSLYTGHAGVLFMRRKPGPAFEAIDAQEAQMQKMLAGMKARACPLPDLACCPSRSPACNDTGPHIKPCLRENKALTVSSRGW